MDDLPLAGFTVAVTAARRREELTALLERRGRACHGVIRQRTLYDMGATCASTRSSSTSTTKNTPRVTLSPSSRSCRCSPTPLRSAATDAARAAGFLASGVTDGGSTLRVAFDHDPETGTARPIAAWRIT